MGGGLEQLQSFAVEKINYLSHSFEVRKIPVDLGLR